MCCPKGGGLGPKVSKQGSIFRQIFLKTWIGFLEISKNMKNCQFSAKCIIKICMMASFGNKKRADF